MTGDHAALDDVLQAGFAAGGTGSLGGSTNVLGRVAEAARAAGVGRIVRSSAQGAGAEAAIELGRWEFGARLPLTLGSINPPDVLFAKITDEQIEELKIQFGGASE